MFFKNQNSTQQAQYIKYLQVVGALSNLFSESETPYLYYRVAENVFCKSFGARNLSRSDHAIDAEKNAIGLGLKTFSRGNNKTWQKVAEFNADRPVYDPLPTDLKIMKIAELRNDRLALAARIYNVKDLFYHCVLREKDRFALYEERMDYIKLDSIKNIEDKRSTITFNDGIHGYSFLKTKSTLTKQFNTSKMISDFEVMIYDDPLEELAKLIREDQPSSEPNILKSIFLPLYGRGGEVFPKSGLNQWNAGGRARDLGEVYIPVPADIHSYVPDFFPPQDKHFKLHFPNGDIQDAKICQQGGKALMTQSNRKMGEWILRDVLQLKDGELLTADKLEDLGIDSVRVDKFDDGHYEIDFAVTGSYDTFISQFN
jgi:hypothetical protein